MCLWAQVEDETFANPCMVEITATDNALLLKCDCCDGEEVCSHMVATLYAYADQKESAGQLFSAVDSAIRDRVQRGRTEVQVELLSGEPWFGIWQAETIASATHFPKRYRVTIRSLESRANLCTCPDFLINQLGTCKHVEAVLHKISKLKDFRKIKRLPAPVSYVYLAWDVEDAPQLHLHRQGVIVPELKDLLDDYFDAAGRFKGRLPDDFFRFSDRVEAHADVQLGEDATGFVRQLATDAAHRLRANEICSRILSTDGRLPGVKARLYPYQIEGVAFLAGTGRALL
ncbi:MAG: SWIM zinc finger family protein, partial [Desulfuromonadales bacterium]|nr:SWIM zinc finger family protein [Desulfuromonadales bacterium]